MFLYLLLLTFQKLPVSTDDGIAPALMIFSDADFSIFLTAAGNCIGYKDEPGIRLP